MLARPSDYKSPAFGQILGNRGKEFYAVPAVSVFELRHFPAIIATAAGLDVFKLWRFVNHSLARNSLRVFYPAVVLLTKAIGAGIMSFPHLDISPAKATAVPAGHQTHTTTDHQGNIVLGLNVTKLPKRVILVLTLRFMGRKVTSFAADPLR